MDISVNGSVREIDVGSTVGQLIVGLGLNPAGVAVAGDVGLASLGESWPGINPMGVSKRYGADGVPASTGVPGVPLAAGGGA